MPAAFILVIAGLVLAVKSSHAMTVVGIRGFTGRFNDRTYGSCVVSAKDEDMNTDQKETKAM